MQLSAPTVLGKTILLVSFLLAMSFTVAAEDEPEAFLISINSDEGQIQGMAISLATTLARKDKEVRILLCGEAGELALEQNIPPSLRPRDISPKEMMLEAMTLGATVQVCELFLPNSGYRQYQESDLVSEIEQANAEEIADFMLRPNVRTFSY
ncbi:MAG: hypothetical protein WED00_07035 [Aquisalimonadaceae bacterium]